VSSLNEILNLFYFSRVVSAGTKRQRANHITRSYLLYGYYITFQISWMILKKF